MKYLLPITLTLLFAFISSSCATLMEPSEPEEKLERYNPDFSYEPETEAAEIGSADLTIALIEPYYPNVTSSSNGMDFALDYTGTEPFNSFSTGLQQTIDKLLLNKGTLVKGPYGEMEEIVYSEKREIDLYLKPELALNVNTGGLKVYQESDYNIITGQETYKYTVEGPISFGGFVYLRMESENYTLLWKKDLKLENKTIQVSSESYWSDAYSARQNYLSDTAIYNAIAKQMEEYFNSSTELLTSYISIPEFQELKTQLEEDMGTN